MTDQTNTCEWEAEVEDSGVWEGSCGAAWVLLNGGPAENEMKFCPGCGKPVVIAVEYGDTK